MPSDLFSVGEVKRFLEIWSASPEWRQKLSDSHDELVASYGRLPTMEQMQALVGAEGGDAPVREDVRRYREFFQSKIDYRSRVKEGCEPSHPGFRAWRRRQIARNQSENGQHSDEFIVHTPIAIEYAQGCSVGCWYCGVDAGPLERLFPYTPENAELHRDILRICLDRIGPATKWACSYWATDPLDNPDYERFMDDFHALCGMYPQTTTAQPDRDLERVRRLLELSKAKRQFVDRFSIQNLRQLDKVLRFFGADELQRVELVMQQPQAMNSFKAKAGRFYRLAEKNSKIVDREKERYAEYIRDQVKGREVDQDKVDELIAQFILPGTNSCMSGFWINLVERFIRLASPTVGSERWPGGWILFEQVSFEDAADFERQLDGLMQRHMPETLPLDRKVAFAPGFQYAPIERGFALSTPHLRAEIRPGQVERSFELLGTLLSRGENTPEEVAIVSSYQASASEAETMAVLEDFFARGYLWEEPRENLFERQLQAKATR